MKLKEVLAMMLLIYFLDEIEREREMKRKMKKGDNLQEKRREEKFLDEWDNEINLAASILASEIEEMHEKKNRLPKR
jgi:hypothetical protein